MATTTLSNAPSSSATLSQKNVQLPNPFEVNDSYILDKAYVTHVSDDDKCDTKILFDLVSNIISRGSTQISAGTVALVAGEGRVAAVTNPKPEFPTLKLISSQMITTRNALHCVHQTTVWILQHLRSYSWDAKALITLAAFALEYGNFVYLSRLQTTEALGNSLKQLNQVQTRNNVSTEITALASTLVLVIQQIREWANVTLNVDVYDSDDVPSLSEAFQVIPLVVYWTIATIVASTGNLVGLSDYNLSDFESKLSPFAVNLKKHLDRSNEEIGKVNDYWRRKKIVENPKDIVDLLKALINPNGSLKPIIYDGTTQKTTDIDQAFKQKYVLLFISSLSSIFDEISLLNSIYDRLQEDPKEDEKGYKKEDFKILWVPVVDKWDQIRKDDFQNFKGRIKFYLVDNNYSVLPGIKLIKDDLKFEGNPIIPVYRPQGSKLNNDALGLIFEWGIDAFPFRKEDGDLLVKKWRWFWDVTKKMNPAIQVQGDRYNFIYGGNDKNWINNFTLAVEKLKKHETIKEADVIIDQFRVGKDDPEIVSRFWIRIESKKPKKHQDVVDCEIVKAMLCLKRDSKGWVILTKGSNIKVLGHGEPMYDTVTEFETWKGKVFEKEGFDIAFKEYYDFKARDYEANQPCEYIDDESAASNVIATITCPNPTCGRVMEVTSVKFRCCHGNVGKI